MEFIGGSYNYYLVTISIVIAILASYVTFDLVSIARNEKEQTNYQKWLVASASILGTGIWTMHFIGMYAYQLPISVHYEIIQTVVSLLLAILGSYLGLLIIHRRQGGFFLALAAAVMGAGIASMHYLGMHSMHLQADMHYDTFLVMLSLFVAVSASWIALQLFIKIQTDKLAIKFSIKLLIATMMGISVAGMHYIGMAAVNFTANNQIVMPTNSITITGQTILLAITFPSILLIFSAIFLTKLKFSLTTQLTQVLGLMKMNEQQLRSMIEYAPDGFIIHDLHGNILDINKAVLESLGYTRDEILSKTVFDFEAGISQEELINKIWPSLDNGGHYQLHGVHKRKDGTTLPVDISLTCFKGSESNLIFALIRDMTETEKLKAHMTKLAMTDELTNLPNRRAFMDLLAKAIFRANRNGNPLSLLMIDIDFFKKINDTYGHNIGDQALKHFTKNATTSLRGEDIIARLGGEEFAVLLEDTNIDEAYALAERLRDRIANSVIEEGNDEIKFTVSVGVALFNEVNMNADTLLNHADQVLYQAKANGRNRVEVYAPL